jgi:hypothetical protein
VEPYDANHQLALLCWERVTLGLVDAVIRSIQTCWYTACGASFLSTTWRSTQVAYMRCTRACLATKWRATRHAQIGMYGVPQQTRSSGRGGRGICRTRYRLSKPLCRCCKSASGAGIAAVWMGRVVAAGTATTAAACTIAAVHPGWACRPTANWMASDPGRRLQPCGKWRHRACCWCLVAHRAAVDLEAVMLIGDALVRLLPSSLTGREA